MLAFVALGLTVIYPFLKRGFSFPQAWLGIAFGFSIPMAYAAQYGRLVPVAWLLMHSPPLLRGASPASEPARWDAAASHMFP